MMSSACEVEKWLIFCAVCQLISLFLRTSNSDKWTVSKTERSCFLRGAGAWRLSYAFLSIVEMLLDFSITSLTLLITTGSPVVVRKADRTPYDVRYSCSTSSEIAVVSISIYVSTYWTEVWFWYPSAFSAVCDSMIPFTAKCLKKWIGSSLLGTRRFNCQPPIPTVSATMLFVTGS